MEKQNNIPKSWPQQMIKAALKCMLILLSLLSLEGCHATSRANVFRLQLTEDVAYWQYAVNRESATKISEASLKDLINRLDTQHGDVILLDPASHAPDQLANTLKWLLPYCDSHQVACYICPAGLRSGVFRTPVYHWVAQFDNPRSLDHASFFLEGKYLGDKKEGYQTLAKNIESGHSPQVFILGSLYDTGSSFGPGESPYEEEMELLKRAAAKSKTELLSLDPLIGP